MPEVIIHAAAGRTQEQKRALMKDITDAVVKNFNVEAGSVTVTMMEAERHHKMKGGQLFSER
jgi:4-oxalocrotonate tautomerase